MRAWLFAAVLACGAVAATATAHAQPGRRAGATLRDRIKTRIRTLRAIALAEAIPMDDALATRLFTLLARFDDETDKLLEKRVDVTRRLAAADSLKDPRAIDRLIDEALANQQAFWELDARRTAELRKILSPAQTAKVLVVLPALERKIQNQLRNAIEGKKAGGGARRGGDDLDDDREPDERPAPPAGRPAPAPPPAAHAPAHTGPPGATQPCDPYSSKHGC